ncbi:MAG: DUF5009 domain-containing protein [Isosphaeraceae bacterium]
MPDPETPAAGSRLLSLDAFRGMTIAGMILVNNPGSGKYRYAPLAHADWDGFTPTDLVFPSFLFIAGAAIPLALDKRRERGDSFGTIAAKVVRRAAIIFALGLFLNAFPFTKPFGELLGGLRIPGVLQRIALCYLAAALIYAATSLRTQILVTLGLLAGYWAALAYIPVPGYGPGGLSQENCLSCWVDRVVMPGHIYRKFYDPEGILSTLPAIATTLIGVLSGRWLTRRDVLMPERVCGLFGAGVLLYWAGCAWNMSFPLNKALWTSSFVLYTAGLSLQAFALCAWLIEVQGRKRWAWPFLVFGSNAILAYVLSSLGARALTMVEVAGPTGAKVTLRASLYDAFASWADPTFASLLFALSYVLVWLVVLSVFYRFRWFVRV